MKDHSVENVTQIGCAVDKKKLGLLENEKEEYFIIMCNHCKHCNHNKVKLQRTILRNSRRANESRSTRINLINILRGSKARTRMATMKFQHHQLLFLASLFFVTYSEAFAATTSTPSNNIQSQVPFSIKRGGSLFSTTDINDEESIKSSTSLKAKKTFAKGFGTTFLTSYNGNDSVNGDVKGVVAAPDQEKIVTCRYVADTTLPTDMGNFRLRAYRVDEMEHDTYVKNEFVGKEPCVIYHADNPPFGTAAVNSVDVPIRIHDQCFTSEVFGSKR